MEFFHKATSFPFMATRRIWYTLSIALVIASIAMFFVRGLNLSVDFTGGTIVEASYPGTADVEKVRAALEAAGFHEPTVQAFGNSHDISARLAPESKLSVDEVREKAGGALRSVDPGVTIKPLEFVGPQVGDELRNSAFLAIGWTLLLVFIYIWFRFHTWRLSVGAILALLHDPILIIGWFALSQTPFDLAVVAALLAVIGYSLNDTIIVFDRIRRALRGQSQARAAPGARPVREPDALAHHHDQGHHAHRGGGAAGAGRVGAARFLRGAGDRHSVRHLFVDLHFGVGGARLGPQGRACVPRSSQQGSGQSPLAEAASDDRAAL
jgi:preprotein translocase subunit SecF